MIHPTKDPGALQANDLSFGYRGSDLRWRLAERVVQPGQTLLLTGPSGAGKTTWLRLLCGLQRPDSGSVTLGLQCFTDLPTDALRAFRLARMGLIFQDFALMDYLTAGENILLPSLFLNPTMSAMMLSHAHELAAHLQIDTLWNHRVNHLSQGERQRVAIARALATKPSCVFADEPTASLDRVRRDAVATLLANYAVENQVPLVLVTHDPELVERFSDSLEVETLRT